MDEILKQIVGALLGYGLAGIVIVILGIAVYVQRKENNDLHEERRKDSLSWQKIVMDNTAAMLKINDDVKQVISAVSQSQRDLTSEIRDGRYQRQQRDPPGA